MDFHKINSLSKTHVLRKTAHFIQLLLTPIQAKGLSIQASLEVILKFLSDTLIDWFVLKAVKIILSITLI